MNCPETTIIIQNPDGSIQIAIQPHLKNKKLIECYKCKTKLIFDSTAKYIQCSNCQTVQGIPGQVESQVQYITIECAGCTTLLQSQSNTYAVQCPNCGTITTLV